MLVELRVQVASGMGTTQQQMLIDEYGATCDALSSAVQRLRALQAEPEKFISAVAEVGTAHRACERARLRFSKYLNNDNRKWL